HQASSVPSSSTETSRRTGDREGDCCPMPILFAITRASLSLRTAGRAIDRNEVVRDEALELHVAGEAQVRAIEPRQLGQEMLESADAFDEPVIDNRFRAAVAHPIPFRSILRLV